MKPIILLLSFLLICVITEAQVTSFEIDSAKFDKPLMATLTDLYKQDQAPRLKLTEAIKAKSDTRIIDSLRQAMRQQDADNLTKASIILDKYGWVSPQRVGMEGSQALFLIIQHAPLAVQQRYLPVIKAAEQRGEILSSNLAILEDRINMRTSKKQEYGSQAFTDPDTKQFYIYPIADIDNLEQKRAKMGLEPMENYAARLGIKWDTAEYKAMLPKIEAIVATLKL